MTPASAGAPGKARLPGAVTFLWVAHVLIGLLHVLVLAPLLLLIIGLAGAGSHQGWQGPPPIARAAPLLLYGVASFVAGLGLRARRRWAALLALVLPLAAHLGIVLYRPPRVPGIFTPVQRAVRDFNVFVSDVPWVPLAWLALVLALLVWSRKSFDAW